MKRVLIFAHFDKQNIIDDYVITYLEELRKYCEIIFVSDGNLTKSETNKINGLCFDFISTKHGEYDFGSYKRGFFLLKEKYPQKFNQIDELIFANDSCYLVGSFEKIFIKINENKQNSVYGLTDNQYINYHLQSYFLIFGKKVFKEVFFINFLKSVTKSKNKIHTIERYEIGLSEELNKNNINLKAIFSFDYLKKYLIKNKATIENQISKQKGHATYLNINEIFDNLLNKNLCKDFCYSNGFYILLLNYYPLIKRRAIGHKEFPNEKLLFLWKEILQEINPKSVKQIENHCSRIGFKLKKSKSVKNKINLFLYHLSIQKFFYIKENIKNNKKIFIIKLLFFKIKFSGMDFIK